MLIGELLAKPAARDLKQEGRVPFYVDTPFQRNVVQEERSFTKAPSPQGDLPQAADVKAQKGDLVLTGYASTWVEDRDREFIARGAFDESLPQYLANNPILLWQHERAKSFGQVAEARTDDFGLADTSVVRKPEQGEDGWRISAFNDVLRGIVRTKSIGGFFDREIIEGLVLITAIELFEISCVSIPSNPLSIYSAAVKAANGMPMPDTLAAIPQMMQLLSMEAVTDPQLVGLSERQQEARYHELAALFVEAKGVSAPDFNSYREVATRVEDGKATQEELDDLHGILSTLNAPDVGTVSTDVRSLFVDEKAGRVLSKSNQKALEDAHKSIGVVLEKVAVAPTAIPAEDAKHAPAAEPDEAAQVALAELSLDAAELAASSSPAS